MTALRIPQMGCFPTSRGITLVLIPSFLTPRVKASNDSAPAFFRKRTATIPHCPRRMARQVRTMSCSHFRRTAALFLVCCLCGCRSLEGQREEPRLSPTATAIEHPVDLKQHVRNNCASLLYDLLSDEKNLSKILIIKRESHELNALVKTISHFAGDSAKQLEQFAKEDGAFDVRVGGLPSGEAATREAVSKTREHELLAASGSDFQFKLLLTQTEALNYGAHLARVAAENDSVSERIQAFNHIEREMRNLYEQVVALLRSTGYEEPGTKTSQQGIRTFHREKV